jgi:hypothetical protein
MDMQTLVASLGCIAGLEGNHFNASTNALIGQELAQLVESPTIRPSALSFASGHLIGALSNPCQVLNSDNFITRPCANNGFADDMILMRLIASLAPRQPFQQISTSSSSAARAFRSCSGSKRACFCLKRCSDSSLSISYSSSFLTAPFLSLTGYCNIGSAKVNANHPFRFNRLWWRIFDLNIDVVITVSMLTQLGRRGLFPLELTCLVFSHIHLTYL